VHAPPEVVRERIEARAAGRLPAFGSDAGIGIFEKMAITEDYGGWFDLVVDAATDISPAVSRLASLVAGAPFVRAGRGKSDVRAKGNPQTSHAGA
jgi:hypothetical protein